MHYIYIYIHKEYIYIYIYILYKTMYKMHFIHSFMKNVSVWDPTAHFKHC